MKKYISIITVVAAVTFTSCSDFLDVQPEGKPTTENYFANDQQAIDAIDMLYGRLHQENVFGREFFWEQGGGQDVVWGRTRGYGTLATLKYSGDESPLRDTFEQFYNQMARANWVIVKLLNKEKQTKLTPVERRSLGEALFVRGMCHFYIAYRYGTDKQGVPFVRYEDFENGYDNSIPKQSATVMDDYKMIIEDMDKAIQYLPTVDQYDDNNKGRAHQAACVAYKAKTYAYWACWDKSQWKHVVACVDELENKYGRGLASTYDEVFTSDMSKFYGKEYLWGVPGYGGQTPGGIEFTGVVLENKGWGVYNGWGQNKPSYEIYEELMKDGKDNVRLKRTLLEYNQEFKFFGKTRKFFSASDVESGFMCNKYMQAFEPKDCVEKGMVSGNGNWPTTRIMFPLIRMAEMYLFRAEANIMIGNAAAAAKDINKVRNRSNLASLDHNPTMMDIYHERRCELTFEFYDALYDLKRWHKSCPELKNVTAKALTSQPRVRKYDDRSNPESSFKIVPYADYQDRITTYDDHLIVFPYPSKAITESNGQLKQNEGYN